MDKSPYIKYKNLYVIPTFHSRINFAKLVRTAFFKVFPDLIAVELPNNIRNEVIEGIDRLPFLSLIAYADTLDPKKLNFIPIDPGDSIIEGINIGLEHNIPVEFIDLSVKDYKPEAMKLPDDYSINQIGLPLFYEKISEFFKDRDTDKNETFRDSINLEEFFRALEEEEQEEDLDISAKDVLREKFMASNLKKMMPLYNRILLIVGMAHWESIKHYLEHPDKIQDVEIDLLPHKYVQVYNIKSSDARFLLRELPYHTHKWIQFKNKYPKEVLEKIETPEELYKIIDSYNRKDHIKRILLKGKQDYEEEFKEFVDLHKLRSLFQYSRNLSLVDYRLLPSLYTLLVASKNIVDDDFAWKVKDQACKYPYDDKSDQYETMRLSMKGGYDPNGRYVKLRRRHGYEYGDDKEVDLKKRHEEEYPGQWREDWEENQWNTVSYPPEDIIEEDYFAYIRKKAKKNLQNQHVKIEEFKSSLLDGIAIKETIRNWAFKKKIFVKNEQQIQGKIDTIIVIFDEDKIGVEKYPYKLTWWAEHDKESDLAFYSTNPGNYLIGPGISHVEVGGLLSIFPPQQIKEVWRYYMDYEYKDTKNKAERLLKAGILYSKERYIIYVAKNPPRKYFFSLAGIKNRELIHLSIDYFSAESLKTIKHIHILAGKDKRKIAHNYIFLKK